MRDNAPRQRLRVLQLLALSLALFLPSCARHPELLVALDEAFVALRPGLAEALASQKPRGFRLNYQEFPLAGGASELAGLLSSESEKTLALILSPLLARALLEGEARNRGETEEGASEPPGQEAGAGLLGSTPLLAIEWQLPPRSGLLAFAGDPLPAYRAAGRALGAQTAAYRAAGEGGAAGGLLFAEGPGRPAAAREAFVAAFQAAAGFPPLLRDLGAEQGPESAKASEPLGFEAAESAVRELLDSELRLLLIAVGEAGPAAARLAEGPGRAIGLASLQTSRLGKAAFLLAPDDEASARLLLAAAAEAARGSKAGASAPASGQEGSAEGAGIRALPYRLLPLGAAEEFMAGGKSLAQRLQEASLVP